MDAPVPTTTPQLIAPETEQGAASPSERDQS